MKSLRESITALVKSQGEDSKKQAEASEEVKGMKAAAQASAKKNEADAENKLKQAKKDLEE